MYSFEIDNYLRSRNWLLNQEEYLHVTNLNNSPQISRISYSAYDNSFVMYTNDNYIWKFYIKGE